VRLKNSSRIGCGGERERRVGFGFGRSELATLFLDRTGKSAVRISGNNVGNHKWVAVFFKTTE
jgi:hypothetical protein